MIWMLAIAVLLLAYSNGANDNFKGVATLYGSDVLGYRPALLLATGATMLGSLSALAFDSALLHNFSGKGLVPPALTADPHFLAAVGLGAALTVLLATRIGFPISTTHALVGALVGAGFARAGFDISFTRLGTVFVVPLIGSPFIASVLASGQVPVFRSLRRALAIDATSCACVGTELVLVPNGIGTVAASSAITASVGAAHECAARYEGSVVGVEASTLLNLLHGLTAAMLVLFASRLGLPVSTTHVTCGALFGIGMVTGQARWGTIRQILLAWVVTLPIAVVLAATIALTLP